MLRIAFRVKAGDARQNITFAPLFIPIAIHVDRAHEAGPATFPFSLMLDQMRIIADSESKIILQYLLGHNVKDALKNHINALLDGGEFVDGFELAVKNSELNHSEIDELINILIARNQSTFDCVKDSVETINTLSYSENMDLIIIDRSAVYYSNGFNVYKIYGNKIIWDSKRISIDGIEELKINDNKILTGKSFYPDSNDGTWSNFSIDMDDGRVITGEIFHDNKPRRRGFVCLLKSWFGLTSR